MNRTFLYHITNTEEGVTIGSYLKAKGYSHPLLVHLKKTHYGILLNGEWSYVYTKLSAGDVLEIRLLETESSEHIPPTFITIEDFQSMIVYEDQDILLMNKPAGLPVHPSMGHHEDTLANFCAYYYQTMVSADEDGGFIFRCVNRLDRDTSGLVLIAKNMLSSAKLSQQQLNRQIHRTYLAIATGATNESGTISLPIARKEASVIERCVDLEKGDTAVTHYICLDTKQVPGTTDTFSLLQIQLETGRTHQIRVHMKAIGHPLPGDFLYNPDFTYIKRQALHSYRLDFSHPITGESLSFIQDIPEDFQFLPWNYKQPF